MEVRDLRTGAIAPVELDPWGPRMGPDLVATRRATTEGPDDRLVFRDLSTLDELWTLPWPATWNATADGSRVYAADRTGRLAEYDGRTGRQLRETELGLPATGWGGLVVGDGALWVQAGDSPEPGVQSGSTDRVVLRIDRATLRATPVRPYTVLNTCGEMVCSFSYDHDQQPQMRVLDPADGQELWVVPAGRRLNVTPGGLLLVADVEDPLPAIHSTQIVGLADPRTGAVRTLPGGWSVVESLPADYDFLPSVRYVIRTDPDSTMGSYLSRVTAAGLRPVGRLPFRAAQCGVADEYMVCSDLGQQWKVLRVTA